MNSLSDCLPILPAFGWDTELRTEASCVQYQELNEQYPDNYEEIALCNTCFKVASYIPGLNIIVGIARIVLFSDALDDSQEHLQEIATMHIIRGVFEVLTGPLLLIVDAIKTLYDNYVAYQYLNTPFRLDLLSA